MTTNIFIIGLIIVVLHSIALYFSIVRVLPIMFREERAKKDEITPLRRLLIVFNITFSVGLLDYLLLVLWFLIGFLTPAQTGRLLPFAVLFHAVSSFIGAIVGYFIYFLPINITNLTKK